ncbi:putative TRAP dicarboxylate transporter, DctP subunit [Desulfamplus magnetovallimortis]|uniref:Putative TRAP dicarboxylate transporter, DctP subunit n=1 Tax=Desulfamplus magnetovallimortis TaxID=1246637 RepID=A0A1W1HD92_9BACT|nr:DctP family TRAP transporter solute-binding subunit [Desulfamplus magnetovallimortis]SLM30471.1 putative TRAP dicarboxylate transporter, DctP subunit [Desulfamplus magnetovallimortis]
MGFEHTTKTRYWLIKHIGANIRGGTKIENTGANIHGGRKIEHTGANIFSGRKIEHKGANIFGGRKLPKLPLFLIALLFLCFAPYSRVLSEPSPVQIRFSHVDGANTPRGWGALEFAKRINRAMEGKIEIEVFSDGVLYNDNQAIEAVAMGALEMAAPSSDKFKGFVPGLQLFDIPFLFNDINSVHKAIDAGIGRKIKELFEQRAMGITLLGFWDNSFKQFTCNTNALQTPLDFKDLKLIIGDSEILQAQINAFGAYGYQTEYSKVYEMLERGIMDGQEDSACNIYNFNYNKVQRYLTFSNHGYMGYLVIINQNFWKSLPWTMRKQMTAILKDVTAEVREKAIDLEKRYKLMLRDYAELNSSFEIVDLSQEEKRVFRESAKETEKMFYDIVPEEWIKRIRDCQ